MSGKTQGCDISVFNKKSVFLNPTKKKKNDMIKLIRILSFYLLFCFKRMQNLFLKLSFFFYVSTVELDEQNRSMSDELMDNRRNYSMLNSELSMINARLNSGAAGGTITFFIHNSESLCKSCKSAGICIKFEYVFCINALTGMRGSRPSEVPEISSHSAHSCSWINL